MRSLPWMSTHKACLPAAPDGLLGAMAARAETEDHPVTLDDIKAAAARIEGAVVRTPTMLSRTLSESTGATVYIKFENLQFTRSEEHTSELQSLMRISYAVFCLKNKNKNKYNITLQIN